MKLTELNGTLKELQKQLDKADIDKQMVSKLQDIVGLYGDDLINEVIRLKDMSTSMTESKPPEYSIKEIIDAISEQLAVGSMWVCDEEATLDTDSYDDEVTIRLCQADTYNLNDVIEISDVEQLLIDLRVEKAEKEAKAQEQEDKLRAEEQDDAEAFKTEEDRASDDA